MGNIKIKRNYLFFPDREKSGTLPNGEPEYRIDAKLRLRVRWDNYKVDFNLGYRVKLSQWDTASQRCKVKTTNLKKQSASLINGVIQHFETTIDNVFKAFEVEGIVPTPEQVRTKFNLLAGRKTEDEIKAEKTCLSYFDEFVRTEGDLNNWTKSTFIKFQTIRNHLEEYKPELSFDDLNKEGLTRFTSYLRDIKEMRNTTILKNIAFVKWFLRWATTNGILLNLDYLKFKPNLTTNEKKIIFLEWDELMAVNNHDFGKGKGYLERVRDVFCFCCFTSLRYSDVANLRRSDVFDTYISVTTIKTADALKIELNMYAKAILDKYKNETFPKSLALPVISNQKMNEYLKEVGKACGLDQPITITYYKGSERIDDVYPKYELLGTHAGRRTFICNALSLGIAPQVVMKWTGHSDYKAMKPYIDITSSAKAEAMDKFNRL